MLKWLTKTAAETEFGKAHDFRAIQTPQDFQARVPLRSYESFRPYVERALKGQPDVLWPGQPLYFCESSGTTSGTKYIPITKHSIAKQVQGARDALLCYIEASRRPQFLAGKMAFVSGTPVLRQNDAGMKIGRLSGLVNHYVPNYLQRNRVPTMATNSIPDWAEKVRSIVREAKAEDLRLISGIPPWVQMLLEEAQERTRKRPAELWPNLQVYVHGGVDFRPYEAIMHQAVGRKLDFVETYPASEGFIAFQDNFREDGLLLLLDSGLFYEFVPLEDYGKPDARRLTLDQVEVGPNYAILLSTSAGLYGYEIGDTVRFTSLNPFKLRVSGRTGHFISAFGEHVIQDEVNTAMLEALETAGGEVNEFTVAPFIREDGSYHEWFVEFTRLPSDLPAFQRALDTAMRRQNIYYEHLRGGGMLNEAAVRPVNMNASRRYMESIGKLGGQNKFPRLKNNRDIADYMARERV